MSIPTTRSDLDVLTKGGYGQQSLTEKGLDVATPTLEPNSLEKVSSDAPSKGAADTGTPDLSKSDSAGNSLFEEASEGLITYTGSDMRVMLEVQGSRKKPKQLIELVTLTVSIHREKAPVRACGYINPKAFARGRRTIGGTVILTQFNVDFLYRFLGTDYGQDVSKDTTTKKIDQLPPFNLTLMFQDEYGNGSFRKLLGCEIVTDGTVYSSNDMLTEQSITYMASDFTPLLPMEGNNIPSDAPKAEKTPKDALLERRAAWAAGASNA